MIIKKLNQFFQKHSRVAIGAFALLIIFAFVISDNLQGGCSGPSDNVVGTVLGKEVTAGEMQQFNRDYMLYCQLSGKGQMQLDVKNLLQLKALVQRAEEMGVKLTDDEASTLINTNPLFFEGSFSQKKLDDFLKAQGVTMEIFLMQLRYQTQGMVSDDKLSDMIKKNPQFIDGKFSPAKYDKFLADNHLNDDRVKEILCKFGAVDKLVRQIIDSVVISDAEVKAFYQANAMAFDIRSFKVNAPATVEPTEEELKKFYESRKDMFMTPQAYKAVAAVIPMDKFKAEGEKMVNDEMVQKARFVNPGKSDAEIRAALVQQSIQNLAFVEGSRFIRSIYEKLNANMSVEEQGKIFREWAADNGLIISEGNETPVSPFDPMGEMIQRMPEKGIQLVRNPIPGADGIRIVLIEKRIAPVQLTFEQCKAQLPAMYKNNYPFEAMEKKLIVEVEALKLLAGAELDKALNAMGGTSRIMSIRDFEKDPMMAQVVMQAQVAKVGDISAPQRTMDGFAVVRVIPADDKDFDAVKDKYRDQLLMIKQQSALEEFLKGIDQQCQVNMPEGDKEQQAPVQAE